MLLMLHSWLPFPGSTSQLCTTAHIDEPVPVRRTINTLCIQKINLLFKYIDD
jgi:hypothetical protein